MIVEEADDIDETPAAAASDETLMQEMTEKLLQRHAPLMTRLSAQQIRLILEDICTEMLSGLEVRVVMLTV